MPLVAGAAHGLRNRGGDGGGGGDESTGDARLDAFIADLEAYVRASPRACTHHALVHEHARARARHHDAHKHASAASNARSENGDGRTR